MFSSRSARGAACHAAVVEADAGVVDSPLAPAAAAVGGGGRKAGGSVGGVGRPETDIDGDLPGFSMGEAGGYIIAGDAAACREELKFSCVRTRGCLHFEGEF